jgi:hypothetical protein
VRSTNALSCTTHVYILRERKNGDRPRMSRAVRERIQRASRHHTNASNTHKVCPNNTLLTAHRGAMLRDRPPSPRSAHIRRLVHVVGCLGGWSEVGRAARGKQDKPPLARTPGCHPCAGRFRIGWRPNNTHMQWDEQESNAEGMRGTGRTARGAHKNAHSRDLHAFRTHQRGLQAGWRPSDSLKLCCGIWAMLCAHRGGWARRPWVQGWAARAFGPNAHRHSSQRQSRQVPHALDRRARPHHPRAHVEKKR